MSEPTTLAAGSGVIAFAPVPVSGAGRARGWTPRRQQGFIDALAATLCVTEAARAVGMSRESAYRLRARGDAVEFRAAWDAAIDFGYPRLAEAALGRAINGVPVPIFQRGELVGERRHFDERLTIYLLGAHKAKIDEDVYFRRVDQPTKGEWLAMKFFVCLSRLAAGARKLPPRGPGPAR